MSYRPKTLVSSCAALLTVVLMSSPLLAAPPEQASPQAPPPRMWLNLGLGPAGSASGGGVFLLASAAGQPSQASMLAARFTKFDEPLANWRGRATWKSAGLLYGLAAYGESGWVSATAGPEVVWGKVAGTYDTFTTLGVGAEAQAIFTMFGALGLGLTAPANLNLEAPYAAVLLTIVVGKVN